MLPSHSSRSDKHDSFISITSPYTKPGSGQLREGGVPGLLSRRAFGWVVQNAAVGLLYGALPRLITPFLTNYLNMEGSTTTSARALVDLPWTLKVFLGILTDCVPTCGYRRRPYMVFGWSVAALCLFTMGLFPLSRPYFPDPTWRNIKPIDYTPEIKEGLNKLAPASGGKYIVLMMLTSIGFLVADAASDGLTVEFAQRESDEKRGHLQTLVCAIRAFFGVIAQLLIGFGLSTPAYGGDFHFGISFSTIMLILAAVSTAVVPMTWFFIEETKSSGMPFRRYVRDLWHILQGRAVYQYIAYSFFYGVLSGFTFVAVDPITSYWVKASAFSLSICGMISDGLMSVTYMLTSKFGLHWNWRWMQGSTVVIVVGLDIIVGLVVTWDVFRSQWLWLGPTVIDYVPYNISYVISTYVVVELAGVGTESALFGLLTTVSTLGYPMASSICKNINMGFKVYNDDILNDTHEVRVDVTITMLIAYVTRLGVLALLPLMPKQRAETQRLKREGGQSKLMGIVTLMYLLFALFWSILTNMLSIFESTRCLKIAGGCKDEGER